MKLTRWCGAVIFLAGCSTWIWAPHAGLWVRTLVAGVLGAVGVVLFYWQPRQ